jgi:hypothetical protein
MSSGCTPRAGACGSQLDRQWQTIKRAADVDYRRGIGFTECEAPSIA